MPMRRSFSDEFKATVAREALRGDRTAQEIAAKHKVHPTQVTTWKRQAMDGRGQHLDNIFIERLWRSLKQEAVYLHELQKRRDILDNPFSVLSLQRYWVIVHSSWAHLTQTPNIYFVIAGHNKYPLGKKIFCLV